MRLTIPQKKALTRIASDMVRADNIIEVGEIESINKLTEDYNMQDQICGGRYIKFSVAVRTLSELDRPDRMEIYKRICNLSTSDDVCVPMEKPE